VGRESNTYRNATLALPVEGGKQFRRCARAVGPASSRATLRQPLPSTSWKGWCSLSREPSTRLHNVQGVA
jgi:hypothetical protein